MIPPAGRFDLLAKLAIWTLSSLFSNPKTNHISLQCSTLTLSILFTAYRHGSLVSSLLIENLKGRKTSPKGRLATCLVRLWMEALLRHDVKPCRLTRRGADLTASNEVVNWVGVSCCDVDGADGEHFVDSLVLALHKPCFDDGRPLRISTTGCSAWGDQTTTNR
jgi:hypothetical protein